MHNSCQERIKHDLAAVEYGINCRRKNNANTQEKGLSEKLNVRCEKYEFSSDEKHGN